MKTIRLRLRELRKNQNLSQEQLAERLGITRQSIISLERGEYLPSLPLMLEMLNFFNLPFEQLLFCEGKIIDEKGGEIKMNKEISPWSPIREVSGLHEAIDRMFEESLLGPRQKMIQVNVPVLNVRQTEKSVIVEAELPGVKEDDLDIEVTEDTLTIKGEKKTEEEVKEKDYYRREFTYGSFSRSIALPVPVQDEKAEASLKNGLLRIELPKMEEKKPKVKKISVKK